MSRKKKNTTLGRIEANLLEHVAPKYQKSVIAVYRLGFCISIVGIIGGIIMAISIANLFLIDNSFSIEQLMIRLGVFLIPLAIAILGGLYTRMRLNPALAFGWTLFVGILCFIVTGFLIFLLIGMNMVNLDNIYGSGMITILKGLVTILIIPHLIILIYSIRYLFFAHKGYEKWYKDYTKRHHLNEREGGTHKKKKSTKKTREDYCDDDL